MRALAARYFTDPRMPELVTRAVFAKSWSQLPDAGDHLASDIAGLPIVLIRDIIGRHCRVALSKAASQAWISRFYNFCGVHGVVIASMSGARL